MAKPLYYIGFDLGGTKMLAAIVDGENKIIARCKKKTRAHEGAESAVNRMVETMDDVLKTAGLGYADIAAIGVGCPGPLDLDAGIVVSAPNLGWENLPLKEILEKRTGRPVSVINDVDSGVYGEYLFGAGKGARCVVGVFPGTGIGGGCVYKGEILRGRTSSCMEIGHIMVIPDGPLCGCGRHGCLEAVASRLAIASAVAAACARGDAPSVLESTGGAVAAIKSSVIAASVDSGEYVVEDIVRGAARWLGRGIAASVNLLAPDVVILGGGLVEAMPGLFIEEVRAVLEKSVIISYGKEGVCVKAAALSDDAGVMGAAGWAKHILGGGS